MREPRAVCAPGVPELLGCDRVGGSSGDGANVRSITERLGCRGMGIPLG